MAAPILLFTQEFPSFAGGVATYCDRVARQLAAAGRPVVVVAPLYGPADDDLDKDAPFPVLRYRGSVFFLLRHARRFAALIRGVRRHRPCLIWAADWRVGSLAVPVSLVFGPRVVVTAYGTEVLMAGKSPWKRYVARWTYRRSVVVFAISSYVVRLLTEFGADPSSIKLVPPGVDGEGADVHSGPDPKAVRRQWGLEGKVIVLTLARLTPRKGQDVTIEAIAEVARRRPDVVYMIAGTGRDRPRLEGIVARLDIAHNVRFIGHVMESEKAHLLRTCDIFIMLSRQDDVFVEGFGLAFLEAGVHGKPVVAGRHGGVPDVVIDGETGVLVPPTDVSAAAAAILYLVENPDEARRLGTAARQRATREFTWQRTITESIDRLRPWLDQQAGGL
jgi:phosphatidyl-myo-inositol dimannoside synthase